MLEPVDFFFCLYCFINGISSICSQDYLHQYYNLENDHLVRLKRSEPSFISKVKEMQMFFGLNSTGVLDPETLQVMQNPRCGVPDVEEYSHIQGTRWNKNVLTYRYCVWLRLILLFFSLSKNKLVCLLQIAKPNQILRHTLRLTGNKTFGRNRQKCHNSQQLAHF